MRDTSRSERRPTRRRSSVASRLLAAFVGVTLAFTLVAAWSVWALRQAADDAELMRSGYLPLALELRDVSLAQDTYNSQLNHVTATRNPVDKELWFETAVSVGRPKNFAKLRSAMSAAFANSPRGQQVAAVLLAETEKIEGFLRPDRDDLTKLFASLKAGDENRAEVLRDALVTRGNQGRTMLRDLETSVQRRVGELLDEARTREARSVRVLIVWACCMVLLGAVTAIYVRRRLQPLNAVTRRAKAVAAGDLTPREVVDSNDEIGELAHTFENMVTAISKANKELLAADRLATIGKMAAHVTHEVRNPLSALALNLELLEEELVDASDAQKNLLGAIRSEAERLTALSERYLSVARRSSPGLEEENVGELVTASVDATRRELSRHGVRVELEVESDVPPVRVDDGQIRQVLFNLMRNAREAMPGGGTIRVAVRRGGEGVDVLVDDDGEGMSEETRQRLFEPFFTTKSHGTGLGLVIIREIVEAHGGVVSCDRLSPRGTRFRVHLPPAISVAGTSAAQTTAP